MRGRNKLKTAAVNSNRQEDWSLYRAMRNRCSAELIKDRKTFLKTNYEKFQSENNVKSIYRQVKMLAGWKETGPPSALRVEDQIVRKPVDIANAQNRYYNKKVKDLPQEELDPLAILKAAMLRWGDKTRQVQPLILQPVNIQHTLNLLKKLGASTASGYDGIDATFLKAAAEELASPINSIINLSISTSVFPTKWKIGRLIRLWKGKGKDKLSTESYRPVSLLPVVSKLAEKTIQEQIYRHMEVERLWNPNHHAYKTSRPVPGDSS